MKLLLAIFLILVSLIGWIFFDHYRGQLIQFTFLWKVGLMLVGLLGLWLIVSCSNGVMAEFQRGIKREEELFRKSAVPVPVVFDRCEFHNGTYTQIQKDNSGLSGIRLFAPAQLGLTESSSDFQTMVRSYLVFTTDYEGESCSFVSQSFPVDQATLKYRVLQNQLSLYVHRSDRGRFLFVWETDDQGGQ